MCRRAVALGRTRRSWAAISSSWIVEHAVSRASAAWASPTRARTSSDLTAGTEIPSAIGELGIAHPAQFPHQQRRTLLLGQPPDVRDQAAQRLALLGLRDRVVNRRLHHLDQLGHRDRRAAELVDAAVVRHAVQPRPQGDVAIARPQPGIRPHEHVLQCILGVLPGPGQHLPGVGEQPLAIAVVDHPEGIVMARPEKRHELIVGPQA